MSLSGKEDVFACETRNASRDVLGLVCPEEVKFIWALTTGRQRFADFQVEQAGRAAVAIRSLGSGLGMEVRILFLSLFSKTYTPSRPSCR